MKIVSKLIALCMVLILTISGTGCTQENEGKKPDIRRPAESFLKYGEDNTSIVELNKVNNSVWIHTSYHEYNGSLTPSNGLVVITDEGLVLINTTWTEKQMESLYKLCKEEFNSGIKKAIITHAHINSMGGAGYAKDKGIEISSLGVVSEKATEKGYVKPDEIIDGDEARITVGDTEFDIIFPGKGFTSDNTIVWIEKYDLIYAGCLVKEHGATSLGNMSEASLEEWPNSLNKLTEVYNNIEIVIPGHGQWGDKSLIDYTLELFEE